MSLQISLVHQFEQQQSGTWDVHFSLGGSRLVSSDGRNLYLWQLDSYGSWHYERLLPVRLATFPRFAPDGNLLAFGGKEEFIKIINIEGKELATFPSPSHASWAFSPDQRWLVSSSTRREVLLWDIVTYQSFPIPISFPVFDRSGESRDLSDESAGGILFTPDGQHLIFGTSSVEGYVHFCSFDPVHRQVRRRITFPVSGMLNGVISPGGKRFAMIVPNEQVHAYKQNIYVYDLEPLQLLQIFLQTADERYCLLAFSPDSRYLASCKDDGWVEIFSLETFELVTSFAAHPGLSSHATDPIGGLDWSKTGYIATGGASVFEKDMEKTDYSIKIWKIEEE